MNRFAIPFLCIVVLVMASCGRDTGNGSRKQIDSFVIKGTLNGYAYDIDGSIDQTTLVITLDRHIPDGTEIIPTFRAVGRVICGGKPVYSDRTQTKIYNGIGVTVAAEDGSWISYTLVIPPPEPEPDSNANRIVSYSLWLTHKSSRKLYKGDIDEEKSTITVSPGTLVWIGDLREAVAEFSSEGESVRVGGVIQESGVTANDFLNEVKYTVTAENGDTRRYTVRVEAPQTSGLPIIHLDTGGTAIPEKWENPNGNYTPVSVSMYDPSYSGHTIPEAPAGIRIRGNSTSGYPKKAYRLKFDDKTRMLGLTAARSWVLLANWQDPTLLMNSVAFEIARRLNIPYTCHSEPVEVFLNGSYKGSYMLSEQVQVNPGRVNIDPDSDILLELDSNVHADIFYSANLEMPLTLRSPDTDGMGYAQKEAAKKRARDAFNLLEKALMESGDWREYVDEAGLIDYILVSEITRNPELEHPKSVFIWQREGGKWNFGPVWDFDWAYGYNESGQAYWSWADTQLYRQGRAYPDSRPGVKFFNKFFDDAEFRKAYKARWNEIKPLIADLDLFIGNEAARLASSAGYNRQAWSSQYRRDFAEQIEAMQSWLAERIKHLDSAINRY